MTLKPSTLFLIDGFGALLSAFLLGVILVEFESTFGMPKETLYLLAFIPCVFAIYDFGCYFSISRKWSPFLKAIGVANLLYCCISIGFVFYHYQVLTTWGLIYFLLEFIVVIALASIELKTSKNLS